MFKYDILPKKWDCEIQPPTSLLASTKVESGAIQVTPTFCLIKFFFENFFLKFLFLKNAPFYHNPSSFLVYTGCRSGIRHYKFNFCTLYIPKILSQVYLEWNNDVAFFKYQKSMTKKKFKISKNYVASDSTSVEACREVGGCITMSHFFGKTSYLNIFSLIFGNSYQ